MNSPGKTTITLLKTSRTSLECEDADNVKNKGKLKEISTVAFCLIVKI